MVSLTRIDPEKRMAILPDLFDGFQLVRQWGRVDSKGGQEMHEFFKTETDALAQLNKIANAKRKRGYC